MVTRMAAGAIGLTLLCAAPPSAGDVELPAAGTHVRVKARGVAPRPVVGSLVAIEIDEITIRRSGSSEIVAIPRPAVERFEIRRSESRRSRGAGIGALVGLVVGAGAGIAAGQDCNRPHTSFVCISRSTSGFVLGTAGASLGALIGLVGAPGEAWETIDPTRLRSSSLPGRLPRTGMALAFSITF
jgi:hypothetical protein